MRLDLKIGMVGVVAAALVAIGAFGLGRAPDVAADVQAANVYILSEHVIESAPGTALALYSCSAGPGALLVNKTNFPNTAILGSSGSTTTLSLPLVVIPRGGSIFICVNTTETGTQTAPNGVNTGTINYNPTGGAGAVAVDEDGDLSFDSNDIGAFTQPSCTNVDGDTRVGEVGDDFCVNATGVGTDHLIVPDAGNNLNTVIVTFGCPSAVTPTIAAGALAFPITIQQDAGSFQFLASCRGEAATVTISATPTTVEIVPARSNTSHSLIQVFMTDVNGFPILPGRDVDFSTSSCSIEEESVDTLLPDISGLGLIAARAEVNALNTSAPGSYAVWEFDLNPVTFAFVGGLTAWPVDAVRASDKSDAYDDQDLNVDGVPDRSVAAAILGCNTVDAPGAVPGPAQITACVEVFDGADICVGTTVTVVGPPASITVAASPTSLRCGEKSTVTATVKDSIGQNVSDHTRVEWVTNLGGVIGGTGAVAAGAGLVSPVSSSVGETFGGVATAFLITSEVTTGPYEVIATSGGTTSNDWLQFVPFGNPTIGIFTGTLTLTFQPANTILGGVFSTPPVSAQVTVTCALPAPAAAAAPTITAPRTGTGIVPPNTGDAGLASSSSNSWTLFAIGGIFALTLAGFATLKVVRR